MKPIRDWTPEGMDLDPPTKEHICTLFDFNWKVDAFNVFVDNLVEELREGKQG